MPESPIITPEQRTLAAKALFAEQLSTLSLHAQHGGSDGIKSTAKLMHAAFEKRRDVIMAEVLAGGAK